MINISNSSYNADRDIRKYRTADAELTVFLNDKPAANQEITIAQKKHKFLFGCGAFDSIPLANGELEGAERDKIEDRSKKREDLFNLAILPFYWGRFEPRMGEPKTEKLIKAAEFCRSRNYILKGHPLCWHTQAPEWLLAMDNKKIIDTLLARIKRDVTDFKGLINMWDVINEVVIMPVFDKYDNGITRICREMGRIKTVKTVFEAARAENPGAIFLLNDFDVSSAYDILVEGCLEAGIKIDVIGIQSHMHQGYWGVEKTLQVMENFARFKLPLHFTENSIVSGHLMPQEIVDLNDYKMDNWPSTQEGEERQAEEIKLHYRTLFANPQVESVTWWDIADAGWLNAPAGLIRTDNSIKPAYEELLKLIKGEWWKKSSITKLNQNGRINFNGYLGEYEITMNGISRLFSLEKKGDARLEIRF